MVALDSCRGHPFNSECVHWRIHDEAPICIDIGRIVMLELEYQIET